MPLKENIALYQKSVCLLGVYVAVLSLADFFLVKQS